MTEHPEQSERTVSVIGLGLLGASLLLELEGKYRRIGWTRNPETRRLARETRTADVVPETEEEAVSLGDVVVFCLPVPAIAESLGRFAKFRKPGAVFTDIGSVKGAVERAALAVPGLDFIGSHPMAGTEKSGFANAFRGLYANADVFIVPPPGAREESVGKVERMWRAAGTETIRTDAAKHDSIVAGTSHVPHILASAMTLGVLEVPDSEKQLCFSGCATGFRDTSRVASSSPRMWREIVECNTPAILDSLAELKKHLSEYEKALRDGDYDAFEEKFARGKLLRDEWLAWKKYK